MSLYKTFKTDRQKETEGVEVRINDSVFVIARACRNNIRYTKALEEETRPFRRQIDTQTLDNMIAMQINVKVFCKSILLGWNNVTDENDKPLAFNEQNAIKLMNDLPDLYDELNKASQSASEFKAEVMEKEAKN